MKLRLSRGLPPVIVFATKLEVAQNNCDLCAGDDEDDKDQAQEAKKVVELMQPHWCQDEEQLYEHCSKRKDAANEHAEDGMHVPAQTKLQDLSAGRNTFFKVLDLNTLAFM